MKYMHMTHKELLDQVSANLFNQSGKIESQRSWLAMRNYLEQLDSEQLKLMLKEANWYKQKQNSSPFGSTFNRFKSEREHQKNDANINHTIYL